MAEGAEGGFPYPFFLGLEYSAAFCAGEAEKMPWFCGVGDGGTVSPSPWEEGKKAIPYSPIFPLSYISPRGKTKKSPGEA